MLLKCSKMLSLPLSPSLTHALFLSLSPSSLSLSLSLSLFSSLFDFQVTCSSSNVFFSTEQNEKNTKRFCFLKRKEALSLFSLSSLFFSSSYFVRLLSLSLLSRFSTRRGAPRPPVSLSHPLLSLSLLLFFFFIFLLFLSLVNLFLIFFVKNTNRYQIWSLSDIS